MSSTVTVAGTEYTCIREGLADILGPKIDPAKGAKTTRAGGEVQTVFYNPIQAFNRDLSVLAIKVFAEEVIATRAQKRASKQSKTGKNIRNKRKRDEDEDLESLTAPVPEAKKTRTLEDSAALAGQSEPSVADDQARTATKTAAGVDSELNPDGDENPPRRPKPRFRILDALSATGLRALRYAKEIPEADMITANDLSAEAVQSIKRNVEYNGVQDTVFPFRGNAAGHMYHVGSAATPILPDGTSGRYDVIDLDPYGTAAPFLDAAVQAVAGDGGMLAVTCTDSAVFASVGYLEKTYAQYGGLPWKGSQSHEAGLRLVIHAIATSAARYGLAIEPLLSLSIDYYIRVFVRVRKSPMEVKLLGGKTMTVFNCDTGCGSWTKQYHVRTTARENKNGDVVYHFTSGQGPTAAPNCEHCGFRTHVAGPMWGGHLHNPDFVQRLLDRLPSLDPEVYTTKKRLEGVLDTALHETLLPSETMSEKAVQTNVVVGTANKQNVAMDIEASVQEADPQGASQKVEPLRRLDPAAVDDHPFFFFPSELARVLKTGAPSEAAMRGALIGLGYRVTRSHCKPNNIRTDAPWSVIWEVMRAWAYQEAKYSREKLKDGTAGTGVWKREEPKDLRELQKSLEGLLGDEQKVKAALAMIEAMRVGSMPQKGGEHAKEDPQGVEDNDKEITTQASNGAGTENTLEPAQSKPQSNQERLATAKSGVKMVVEFDQKLGKDPNKGRLVRYQVNPRENWGPQSRAK